MPESIEVVAGNQAYASEYNDLRKDVLDTTLGHDHGGGAGEGHTIATADLTGHDKTAHDALNIDADTLDTHDSAYFSADGHTHALGDLSNVSATGEGTGGGFDADTVDGKHWDNMKYVSATMIVGNKDAVLLTGERAICYIPSNMTLREIRVRELGEISGSCTLNLYRYDGVSDMTEVLIVACSLSSQNNRAITGRSDVLQADDWVALFVTGTSTSVRRVAVALRLERT